MVDHPSVGQLVGKYAMPAAAEHLLRIVVAESAVAEATELMRRLALKAARIKSINSKSVKIFY